MTSDEFFDKFKYATGEFPFEVRKHLEEIIDPSSQSIGEV